MFIRHPLTLLTKEVPAISLEPATTVLLLQDLHAPFADAESGWLAQRARQKVLMREFDDYFDTLALVAPNITRTLALCRAQNFYRLYSCLGYRSADGPSAFQTATGWQWDLDGPDGAFSPLWQPQPDEPVFAKPGWSALANEQLTSTLEHLAIRSVVLVGTMLEFGIRQTALDLADRGYQVLIISDAVVPLTGPGQRFTAGSLAHGLVKLRSTGEFSDLVERLPREGAVVV